MKFIIYSNKQSELRFYIQNNKKNKNHRKFQLTGDLKNKYISILACIQTINIE